MIDIVLTNGVSGHSAKIVILCVFVSEFLSLSLLLHFCKINSIYSSNSFLSIFCSWAVAG